MALALFCSFLLSAVISRIASQTQMRIWWNYVDEEAYFEAVESEGPDYVADIPRPHNYEMTQSDCFVSELCDFLQTYTILVVSMAGSCAAVFLFYRYKLKKPIRELALASKKSLIIIWILTSPMKTGMKWAHFAKSLRKCAGSLSRIIRAYGERSRTKRCCAQLSHTISALHYPF